MVHCILVAISSPDVQAYSQQRQSHDHAVSVLSEENNDDSCAELCVPEISFLRIRARAMLMQHCSSITSTADNDTPFECCSSMIDELPRP